MSTARRTKHCLETPLYRNYSLWSLQSQQILYLLDCRALRLECSVGFTEGEEKPLENGNNEGFLPSHLKTFVPKHNISG